MQEKEKCDTIKGVESDNGLCPLCSRRGKQRKRQKVKFCCLFTDKNIVYNPISPFSTVQKIRKEKEYV